MPTTDPCTLVSQKRCGPPVKLQGNHCGLLLQVISCSGLRARHPPHPDDVRAGAAPPQPEHTHGKSCPQHASSKHCSCKAWTPASRSHYERAGDSPDLEVDLARLDQKLGDAPCLAMAPSPDGKDGASTPSILELKCPQQEKEEVWCSARPVLDKGRPILWVFPSDYCTNRPESHTTCPLTHIYIQLGAVSRASGR